MAIQVGLPQGLSTGWLGLTLGDWPSGPSSLGGKDEPGLPELEGSLRVKLYYSVEKIFGKKVRFGGKWRMLLISLYAFAHLKSLTVDFTGCISIPKWR